MRPNSLHTPQNVKFEISNLRSHLDSQLAARLYGNGMTAVTEVENGLSSVSEYTAVTQ
jgi:hypothetical protein